MGKNLVFTSAGDNTMFHKLWYREKKNYDIMVVYYGNNHDKYEEYKNSSEYIFQRKGSKFQNFHYIYTHHKELLDKYDRFFVLDDDIIISSSDINNMFAISEKYDLWICGPTFPLTKSCRISHRITISRNTNTLRYVNFIEVNVPLLNSYAVDKLMELYDESLIGWGIDYLYIWACGINVKNNALIDSVRCINPHNETKKDGRELHKIKNAYNRAETWRNFARKHNMHDFKHVIWNVITI